MALDKDARILFEALRNNPVLAALAIALLATQGVLLSLSTVAVGVNQTILILGAIGGFAGLIWTVRTLAVKDQEQRGPTVSRPAPEGLLESDEALIEITFDQQDGKLNNPRVTAVSELTKEFFGKTRNASIDQFVGRDASSLMAELKPYIDPPAPHWDDLGKDQLRIQGLLSDGRRAYANVPVTFNKSHPNFPEMTFLPLIVERGRFRDETGSDKEFRKAVYIDVTSIPLHLFRQQSWHELSEQMNEDDFGKLADDFGKIVSNWRQRGDSDQIEKQIDSLAKARTDLRRGGSPEVIHHCAEAGWFAIWDTAMVQKYETALDFLEKVARLTEDGAKRDGGSLFQH